MALLPRTVTLVPVIVLMVASAGSPAAAQEDGETLSVWVRVAGSSDMSERQRLLLARALRTELGKRRGVRVTREPSRGAADVAGCSTEESRPPCLVRLARQLGVDEVVMVGSAAVGASRVLTLKRLHVIDGRVVGAVTRRLTGGASEAYLWILDDALAELFSDRPLAAGSLGGVAPALVDRWDPPPLRPWLFWTGVGVTGVGVVMTVAFAAVVQERSDAFRALAGSGQVVSGSELVALEREAHRWSTATNVTLGLTLGAAVSTAICAFFTDWGSDGIGIALLPHGAGVAMGVVAPF